MSKKNIALGILLILALIIFIIGIYLLFFRKPTTGDITTVPQFPTASTTTPIEPSTSTEPTTSQQQIPETIPLLNKLSLAPTAGSFAYQTQTGTSTGSTTVRYTDRATGHTFEISPDGFNRIRRTATTIPQAQEAYWSLGSVLLRRALSSTNQTETIVGRLATTSDSVSILATSEIPTEMTTVVLSPQKDRLFFIAPDENLSGRGVLSSNTGLNLRELFTLPTSDWIASWPHTNTITLTTKASAAATGYLYFVNTTTGVFTKILGNITGLTTNTNASTSLVLYTEEISGYPETFIFNVAQKVGEPLIINTLSEKCVWSSKNTSLAYCALPTQIPRGTYPDDWYKGKVLFKDRIVRVDAKNQTVSMLYNISESEPIDAFNLFLDDAEDYLFFTNKHDYFLWSLRIKDL